jgi:hypothetical protein
MMLIPASQKMPPLECPCQNARRDLVGLRLSSE